MYKISSYLMIAESVVLKKIYKNLLELVNVCALVFLLVKCPRNGLKGKYSVFYRDKRVKEC